MKSNSIKKKFALLLLFIVPVIIIYINLMGQDAPVDISETNTTETMETNNNILENTDAQYEGNYDSRAKEENNNLFSTVKRGGPLMIFIVFLGLVSLTIIIERLIYFTRNMTWKGTMVKNFLKEIADKSGLVFREDFEDELNKSFKIYSNGMERGMSLLSGIGNIAPIVGFLGTVIGMIRAFASIAAATTVNAKVVAVGIQIALVTTAGGLVVAAPTLAFYYLFTHVIQNRYADAEAAVKEICGNKKKMSDLLDSDEETYA